MNYYTIKPNNKLADIVRCFWVFEGVASEENPYIHRTLASGFPELLFHYQGIFEELKSEKPEKSFFAGVHGQTNQFSRFIIKEKFGIFGVQLYPYALSTLFSISAAEFTNKQPQLLSFIKESEIEEKMLSAINNTERLYTITSFLENKRQNLPNVELTHIVNEIINKNGIVNVKELSEKCFLSHRQFERKFKAQIGFSAKTFSKLIRFNAVLKKSDSLSPSLTEMAYSFGYYDQSHFIQDFKQFSGYTPRQFFSQCADELSWNY